MKTNRYHITQLWKTLVVVGGMLVYSHFGAADPAQHFQQAHVAEVGMGSDLTPEQFYVETDLSLSPLPSTEANKLFAPLKRKVTGLVHSLGADITTTTFLVDVHNRVNSIRTQDVTIRQAYRAETVPEIRGEVTTRLQEDGARIISQDLTSQIELAQKLRGGLKFNMNLSSLWGAAPKQPDTKRPSIKYGLVLKDIEPGHEGTRQAAIGEFRPEDLRHAGQAKVVWGIGPIVESDDERMFFVKRPEMELLPTDGSDDLYARMKHWWRNVELPDANFDGYVNPKAAPSLGGVPPMEIVFRQVQGFYWTEYHTRENFQKEVIVHGTSVPIYRGFHVQQRFDESFSPVRTSACHLLMDPSKPYWNVHYLINENRYQSDLLFHRPGFLIGFSADTPANWDPAGIGTTLGERYDITIHKNF